MTMRRVLELASRSGHEVSLWTCQGSLYFTVTREEDGTEATFEAKGETYAEAYDKVVGSMKAYLLNRIAEQLERADDETKEQVQCAEGDPIRNPV